MYSDKSNFFMRFRHSNSKELEHPIFPLVEQIASILEQFLSLFPQPDLSVSHEQFATNVFYQTHVITSRLASRRITFFRIIYEILHYYVVATFYLFYMCKLF